MLEFGIKCSHGIANQPRYNTYGYESSLLEEMKTILLHRKQTHMTHIALRIQKFFKISMSMGIRWCTVLIDSSVLSQSNGLIKNSCLYHAQF